MCCGFTGVERKEESGSARTQGASGLTELLPIQSQKRCGESDRALCRRVSGAPDAAAVAEGDWIEERRLVAAAAARAELLCLSAAAPGWRATSGLPGARDRNGG